MTPAASSTRTAPLLQPSHIPPEQLATRWTLRGFSEPSTALHCPSRRRRRRIAFRHSAFSPPRSHAASSAQVGPRHGYLLAVLAIALSTALFLPGRDTFAKGQWALLYLLLVVLVAGASGAGPAVLAAVLGFFAWDFFFLPPYHTLTVHDPKDWLSLVAFLAVGVVDGRPDGSHARSRGACPGPRARDGGTQPALGESRLGSLDRPDGRDHPGRDRRSARRRVGDAVRRRRRRAHHLLRHAAGRRPDSGTATVAHWVYAHDAPVGLPTPRRST